MAADPLKSLILADESTGDPFVVGGSLTLPPGSIVSAMESIRAIKSERGVAPNAKIHCRILFAGSARLKSPFKHLSVGDCHTLLIDCVDSMLKHNGEWAGSYVNAELYPRELRLPQGDTFPVTKKHLAGLMIFSAVNVVAELANIPYQLAFDPDPSQVDWGLLKRMQATHFARIDPQSIQLSDDESCLLDLADIAAYTLAQSILCQYLPTTRKPWHLPFPDLLKRMKMRTGEFAYTPSR